MKTLIGTLAWIVSLWIAVQTTPAQSPSIWNGGGSDDNWSNASNWSGNLPVPGPEYDLQFGGATRLTPFNDLPAASEFRDITFNVGAGAFTLRGNAIALQGSLVNYSTVLQTLDLGLSATGIRTITTAAGGGDITIGGNISGTGGGLFKAGTGTLTLSGANTHSGGVTNAEGASVLTGSLTNSAGPLAVTGGTLTISGPVSTGSGGWLVSSADKAMLHITTGANIVKSGNFHVGNLAGFSGAVNVAGGSFASSQAWSFNNFSFGALGYGALHISGGHVDARGLILGGTSTAPSGLGIVTVSGGLFTVDANVVIPYYSGTGVLTVRGNGELKRTALANALNVNLRGDGRGEVNLLGGILDNGNGIVGFGTGSNPRSGGSGIINLDAGTFTTVRFNATSYGFSRVNFNGGTLRASTNRADFLPTAISSVYVNGPFGSYAGGAVIDSADWAITIGAPLLAPTGEGVSALGVTDGGSGYIGAPYVKIEDSSGFGFGATAIAHMADDGTGSGTLKVTHIEVTNPGVDYTAGSTSYTLLGGAPTVPATPGAASTTANTSGGLTKLGTGTLVLTGDNTYTGTTTISNGTLVVNNGTGPGPVLVKAGGTLAGNGTVSGSVTVENGAAINPSSDIPGSGIVDLMLGGHLYLQDGGTLGFDIADAYNADRLLVGGNLNPSGTTTISVPGVTALANGDYVLIEVAGTLGGSAVNFSVTSPTPAKVYSVVYASGTPNQVVLRVADAAVLLTWAGAGNVWDVGTSPNWLDLGGASTVFNDNDPVIFDNTGAAQPVVNITVPVSPVEVNVDASSDYAFTGAGHIAGAGALRKAGFGSLTLSNANTFSGGVALSAGTLNLNHPSALGTGALMISGGTLDNTSGSPLALTSDNPQAWEGDFSFKGTADLDVGDGPITPNGNRILTIDGGTLRVGGDISGAGGLTKTGAGRLALGGANTYSGPTIVNDGTLALTGSLTNSAGALTVNQGSLTLGGPINTGSGAWLVNSGDKAVLNISDGAAITKSGNFHVGRDAGYNGAVNVSGGSFTSSQAWGFNNFSFGALGYGALNISGGQVDTRGLILGGSQSDATGLGIVTISGGTFTFDANVVIPYYAGTGVLTVSTNGTLTRTSGGNITVNQKGNGRGELNLTGGAIDTGNGLLGFGTGASPIDGGIGIANLNAGTLTTTRFNVTNGTMNFGVSRLNFGGGTLRPSASRADFVPVHFTSVYVNGPFGAFAGGAVIDTADWAVTIGAPLLAPTGDGVSALAVTDGGSGYIGAPYVKIEDGSGTGFGATAIAHMVDDGTGKGTLKVARIEVTNPGVDYTAGTTSFFLTGGAPTIPATTGAVSTAANTSGGLTKLGTGTLTLSGASTYTGTTVVNAGLLAIDGSLAIGSAVTVAGGLLGGSGVIGGPVTVESSGTLSPGTLALGTLTIGNTLTLAAGSTTTIEVDKNASQNDLVIANAVNYGGKLWVQNLAGALSVGDAFPLFSTPAPNGNFSEVTVVGGAGTFDPATGVLTITGLTADYPTNMTYSVSDGTLALSWPESHLGWYAQSNSVSVADPNAWYDITGSETVTNLNLTINPALPQVYYRLRQP